MYSSLWEKGGILRGGREGERWSERGRKVRERLSSRVREKLEGGGREVGGIRKAREGEGEKEKVKGRVSPTMVYVQLRTLSSCQRYK